MSKDMTPNTETLKLVTEAIEALTKLQSHLSAQTNAPNKTKSHIVDGKEYTAQPSPDGCSGCAARRNPDLCRNLRHKIFDCDGIIFIGKDRLIMHTIDNPSYH